MMNEVTVVLLGNPNTGKSALFNALSGLNQKVGHYPGVTVEKKQGRRRFRDTSFTLIDLPGTYSLSPHSPDEKITVDVLLHHEPEVRPDAVLCVVDASNLARNLYVVTQVIELGLPVVMALNMTDLARKKGLIIDVIALEKQLGIPVVETQANRKFGVESLLETLSRLPAIPSACVSLPEAFNQQTALLKAAWESETGDVPSDFLVGRVLLDTTGFMQGSSQFPSGEAFRLKLSDSREQLKSQGHSVPAVEPISRYEWIQKILPEVLTTGAKDPTYRRTLMDRFLMHRVSGSLVFLALMVLVFQAVFQFAAPAMDLIDQFFSICGDTVTAKMGEGTLTSLVVDGVIAGVGSVVIFLPQILILFFFVGWLEDCGYMARAAYLMDRIMGQVGLSGKSFIPLLSSFACAIPGIMAARVIENRRDRLVTMLVAPLMSCSARLPVYVLLTAACIPNKSILSGWLNLQGVTLVAMYLLGIVVAVGVTLVLKKTVLQGETPPFVMELPSYKWPNLLLVLRGMARQGWEFVRQAGTLIFAVTILIWVAGYFPRDPELPQKIRAQYPRLSEIRQHIEKLGKDTGSSVGNGDERLATIKDLKGEGQKLESEIEAAISGSYLRSSVLGRMGQIIEPVVRPLGWDWKIGIAVIASFPAREVVVGTMGVIYNLSGEQSEESRTLREHLQGATWDDEPERQVFTVPVALSIMVFFALCAQCVSTLAVMKRETRTWRWPVFTFVYMTTLAYIGAWLTYRSGIWFMGG